MIFNPFRKVRLLSLEKGYTLQISYINQEQALPIWVGMEAVRKVAGFPAELQLHAAGVDNGRIEAFSGPKRLAFESEGSSRAVLEVVIDKALFSFRSLAMDVTGSDPVRQVMNLYSLEESFRTESARLMPKGRDSWNYTIEMSYDLLERQGRIGMEYADGFRLLPGSSAFFVHASTIAKEDHALRLEEQNRRITTMVIVGGKLTLTNDALSVTFKD